MKKIRVLLADDHTLFRSGIRLILERIAGVEVVAEASTGHEALHLTKTTHPDVILMDIRMKELNGLEATAYILQEHPQVRVLMLSMHDSEPYVIRALSVGAAGYLLKDAAPAELEQAIKAVARSDTYLSPAVAKHVFADYRRRRGHESKEREKDIDLAESLTLRQREILQLIAEGHTARQIAALLHINRKTVEAHRTELMRRLDVHNVAGLIRYAIRLGLVTLDE
jgi:DNA-binding NarL/FixJ family response regulator